MGILGRNTSEANGLRSRGSPLLAGTDEKWFVKGGNDQIVTGLLGELPAGTLQISNSLVTCVPTVSPPRAPSMRAGHTSTSRPTT